MVATKRGFLSKRQKYTFGSILFTHLIDIHSLSWRILVSEWDDLLLSKQNDLKERWKRSTGTDFQAIYMLPYIYKIWAPLHT